MIKEQRKNILARSAEISDMFPYSVFAQETNELVGYISAALDYIEQLEARAIRAEADYEKARNHATNLINDLINANMNLEIMTARAEALEMAIESDTDGNTIPFACRCCKYSKSYKVTTSCRYFNEINSPKTCNSWQFDQSRFSEKPTPCQEGDENAR